MSGITEPIWRPRAILDSERIKKKHLEESGRNSAQKIQEEIRSTAEFISLNPYVAALSRFSSLRKKKYRAFPVNKSYVMLYKAENGKAVIYRIVDGRTNYADWVE